MAKRGPKFSKGDVFRFSNTEFEVTSNRIKVQDVEGPVPAYRARVINGSGEMALPRNAIDQDAVLVKKGNEVK